MFSQIVPPCLFPPSHGTSYGLILTEKREAGVTDVLRLETRQAYAVEPELCRTVGPRESQPGLPMARTTLCGAGLMTGLPDCTSSVSGSQS
jgi:hypothetical protein